MTPNPDPRPSLRYRLCWLFKLGWEYVSEDYSLHCHSLLYRNRKTGELRWSDDNE